MQQYPRSITYSTMQMDQSWSSTYVIQPDSANQPTHITPSLSGSSQSTIVNTPPGNQLPPKFVNTPQFQSSLSTNIVQTNQPSHPSIEVTTPNHFSQSSNSTVLPYKASLATQPQVLSKGTGLPLSNSRRRAWKWSIIIVACLLIIAMLVLLPLLSGFVTSKNSVASSSGIQLASTRTLPALTPTPL